MDGNRDIEVYPRCFAGLQEEVGGEVQVGKGLSAEHKRILDDEFQGQTDRFLMRLIGSYMSMLEDLREASEGKLRGRVGDIHLGDLNGKGGDPGGNKNVLIEGYDPKSRRFSFVLLDVTEYEDTPQKIEKPDTRMFGWLGSFIEKLGFVRE